MKVRRKSLTLDAEEVTSGTNVSTRQGSVHANAGDFIMKYNNEEWVVPKDDFERLYERY